MTRINSAIFVKNLTDEHLLAEHREIKRLPFCLEKAKLSGSIETRPNEFKLGKGHVLFFLDKMSFVISRYEELRKECLTRGFNIHDYSENFYGINNKYFNDYIPTETEKELLINRITDKIMNGKKNCYHYYGNKITKHQACFLLINGVVNE